MSGATESIGVAESNLSELFSCKGKVIVITGAGRGLGLNICNALAQVGTDIAGIDIAEEPHESFKSLTKYGIRAKYYRADVTKHEVISTTIQQIVEDFGHIDGCVPAAGILREVGFLEHSVDDIVSTVNVNLIGVFMTLQCVVKQLVKQGKGGTIVTIASVASHQSLKSQTVSAYVATKFGVRGLTKQIAAEFAQHGIRANSISPGPMLTDMTKQLMAQKPEVFEVWNSQTMLNRMGHPNELNGAVVFLMSPASSYVTGEDILIDGGMVHT